MRKYIVASGIYKLQARNIKNKPIVNRDVQSIRFEEMQCEIKVRFVQVLFIENIVAVLFECKLDDTTIWYALSLGLD